MTIGIVVWFFCVYFLSVKKDGIEVDEKSVLQKEKSPEISLSTDKTTRDILSVIEQKNPIQPGSEEIQVSQNSLLANVPFTSQAPFGEWNDPIFQNGCEEATLVMAEYWITGKVLTKEIAKKEIASLVKFEEKEFGQSIDTSAKDTEKLLRDYYNVTTSEVRTDITILDIQKTLVLGALVIVPADGRKLQNPNYKQPGPTTHMLVIIGYDAEKKEFITNDSGTRNGKNYRYKEEVLFGAIRDYPTGDHVPIKEIKKVMIVVKKG